MKDWAFVIMMGLIVISIASCTAVGIVSENNYNIEIAKIKNGK
jgi:hypothetical protein